MSEREKNGQPCSDQWDFGFLNVDSIMDDMRTVWGDNGTEVLKHIAELFKWESKLILNFGYISLYTAAIVWKQINDEIETLKIDMAVAAWGKKTERRKVLKSYRMTDYTFTHHADKREELIFILCVQKAKVEQLILEISAKYQIPIPTRKPDWFTNEPWLYPKDIFDNVK